MIIFKSLFYLTSNYCSNWEKCVLLISINEMLPCDKKFRERFSKSNFLKSKLSKTVRCPHRWTRLMLTVARIKKKIPFNTRCNLCSTLVFEISWKIGQSRHSDFVCFGKVCPASGGSIHPQSLWTMTPSRPGIPSPSHSPTKGRS